MIKKIIILAVIFLLLKQLVWVSLVPLWHFPDEQAHFAQVAYLAESGSLPEETVYDLTEEIRISENLLGTERDLGGNNKFTFHPEYKINYSNNLIGIYESEIIDLAKDKNNRKFTKTEASHYPPLYYFFASIVYKIFYYQDIFLRVFFSRIIQLIFYVGTVFVSFAIANLFFARNKKMVYSVLILVAFHPMFSFVSAGINSDNMGNFIFTLFIYVSLKTIKERVSPKNIIRVLLISLLSICIKPQFYITALLVLIIILYKIFVAKIANTKKYGLIFTLFIVLVSFFTVIRNTNFGLQILLSNFYQTFNISGIVKHFTNYALPHLYREVLPWYWGVFDWLGVTYPRFVHRTINWILLFAIFGFIIYMARGIKQLFKWPLNGLLYLVIVNVVFFLGVYEFDLIQFSASNFNFHLGVQGRYFFPLIFSHMLFIVIGWQEIFKKTKLLNLSLNILVSLMMILHGYAVYVIARTYYSLNSLSEFILEASQYKPWFFKGYYLGLIILLALTLNMIFLIKYLKYPKIYDKSSKKQGFTG